MEESSATLPKPESIQCRECSHQILTSKTVSYAGDKVLTCPKCKLKNSLESWRQQGEQHPPAIAVEKSPDVDDKAKLVDLIKLPFSKTAQLAKFADSVKIPTSIILGPILILVGLLYLLSYEWYVTCLAVVIWLPIALFSFTTSRPLIKRFRSPILIVGLVMSLAFARYQIPSVDEWKSGSMRYTDYRTGFGNKIYYREVSSHDNDISWISKGPMSESEKQHGMWETTAFGKNIFVDYHHETKWHWYGEEVTEGEWHLRNK